MTIYAICCTSRTGSSWLCKLLGSTGLLGRPREHFNISTLPSNKEARRMLTEFMAEDTTANGLFGTKGAHGYLQPFFEACDLAPRLTPRCIWLRRRDALRQAISNYRAVSSGHFIDGHSMDDSRRLRLSDVPPAFDRERIEQAIVAFAIQNERWRTFFAGRGIEPLELWYEEINADPLGQVQRIAAWLGVEGVESASSDLRVMRDEVTEQMAGEFCRESKTC